MTTSRQTTTAPPNVLTTSLANLDPSLGLGVRPFGGLAEFGPMAAMSRLANAHDDIPWLPTEENMRTEIDGADGLDPATDIVLVHDDAGLAAFAGVQRVVRDGTPNYDAWGAVRPDLRRRGIGGALLDRNLGRIRARARLEDPGVPVIARSHVGETEAGHRSALEARGFTPDRHFFLMRRDDLGHLPAVVLPDGLEIRPVDPSTHRQIWEAESEAFQDHWGSHTWTEHDFQATFSQSTIDTSLWAVAWDGDEVAGVVQGWIWTEENETFGVRRGWLEHVSVRRQWRRRGLASALTISSMERFRDTGMTEAVLGVDSENPTGAMGLYERLGFVLFRRSAAYRLRLPAVPSTEAGR